MKFEMTDQDKFSFEQFSKFDSRLPAMLRDLLASREKTGGRVADSSFKRIPSIKSFKVNVGEWNQYLQDSGLERRLPADFKYIVWREQNRANRYMQHKIDIMRQVLKDGKPHVFWKMVDHEMKNSTAFRTSAINTVLKGWYKNEDVNRVIRVAIGVDNILKNNIGDLRYYRVEIPKGRPEEIAKFFLENPGKAWPGKMRPLGVPTAPWRVVLHMWNGFLTLFLEEELKSFNHAYMPKVGTITAIKALIDKVRHAKFIYEFDIKGFFNNVHIQKTMDLLRERGMTDSISERLRKILLAYPANLDLPAVTQAVKYGASSYFTVGKGGSLSKVENIRTEYDASLAKRKWHIENKGVPKFLLKHLKQSQEEKEAMMKGLPQGAAPSTILSLLSLSEWNKTLKDRGLGLLMYADDGLIYADRAFNPEPPEGFEFAKEKCKWIRKEGEVMSKEVKFLGVTYNFDTKMLRGSTRNGSALEFEDNHKDLMQLLREITPNGYDKDLLGALVASGIFGLALSKLYGGKFGKLEYEENQIYKVNSYWAKYHNLTQLQEDKNLQRTASTVACGWLIMLNSVIISKRNRRIFSAKAKEYHKARRWEVNEKDILASLEWQQTWDNVQDH